MASEYHNRSEAGWKLLAHLVRIKYEATCSIAAAGRWIFRDVESAIALTLVTDGRGRARGAVISHLPGRAPLVPFRESHGLSLPAPSLHPPHPPVCLTSVPAGAPTLIVHVALPRRVAQGSRNPPLLPSRSGSNQKPKV